MKETKSNQDQSSNRRKLVSAVLATGTWIGLSALGCSDTNQDSSEDASEGGSGEGSGGRSGASATSEPASFDADIGPLNALLSAEYQALAAYDAGIGLIEAASSDDPLAELAPRLSEVAQSIRGHHSLHAEALVESIQQLGGKPVAEGDSRALFVPPQLLLDHPTILNVLRFAAGAERAAAVAYAQTVEGLEAATSRYLAGAIGGDEGEHFIVLAALVLGLAAPGPALNASTTNAVVPNAFISSVSVEPGLQEKVPDYYG